MQDSKLLSSVSIRCRTCWYLIPESKNRYGDCRLWNWNCPGDTKGCLHYSWAFRVSIRIAFYNLKTGIGYYFTGHKSLASIHFRYAKEQLRRNR